MSDLELIFSMLGKAAATEITRERDSQGFEQNKDSAQRLFSVTKAQRHQGDTKGESAIINAPGYRELRSLLTIQLFPCHRWFLYRFLNRLSKDKTSPSRYLYNQ